GAVEAFARWSGGEAGPRGARADAEVLLWRARELRAAGDRAACREALEEVLGRLARASDRPDRETREEALADVLALQLDAGELAASAETCARVGPLPKDAASCGTPLHVLALVARWLRGEGAFPALHRAFERTSAVVPSAWAELEGLVRGHDERPEIERVHPRAAPALNRRAVGAQAVVALALDPAPGARVRLVASDVAPALEDSVERWARARRDGVRQRDSIENEAVRTGRAAIRIRCDERAADGAAIDRACIDGERGRPLSVAVVPVLEGDDVIGLVWVECAHRSVPLALQRAELARAAAEIVAPNRGDAVPVRFGEALLGERDSTSGAALEELEAVWAEAVAELSIKTAERRWVAFQRVHPAQGLTPVAAGGDGAERVGPLTPDGAWAVRRVLRTGGFVRYETDPTNERAHRTLHGDAASGAAVAVQSGAEVAAVLVVESARRGDSRERDVVRWTERLDAQATRIACAGLHARDRLAFDGGCVLASEAPDEAARIERMRAVARLRSDALVIGEPGSGRRTTARWIGHAVDGVAESHEVLCLSCFGLDADELRNALEGAGRIVVLSELEWLAPPAQAELLRRLAGPRDSRARVLATRSVAGLRRVAAAEATARPSWSLHPELPRRLERVALRVPPLRDRRHAIPSLARFLAQRIADDADAEAADVAWDLQDEAAALLWRHDWPGNCADLEAVLHAAILVAGGGPIELEHLERAFEEVGLEPVGRLPSREPRPRDVAAAAWVTRTATQRLNKTRAALYAGWDPNTYAARLRDLGIASLDDAAALLAT
ncbi:MAG: hypothetical protein AAGA20_23085, partial [Planctomycetota bacterium]